ncbi:hypothetical protein C4559_01525 [Candidatus Microgenomates bacterium]|nr:MAG: hypothetical protein C4559_01525 [Candidatus Microgenomates bacterium]
MTKKQDAKRFFKKSKPLIQGESGKDRKILGKNKRASGPLVKALGNSSKGIMVQGKSPSNSRIITDKQKPLNPLSFKIHFSLTRIFLFRVGFSLLIMLLLSGLVFASLDLYSNIKAKQKAEAQRTKIAFEIKYWQGIVEKYKDYRDGYFKLAVLNYQLGDSEKSRSYLNRVLEIDPGFEAGRKLEKILGN